jgi:uncharacterized OsmC-like protein
MFHLELDASNQISVHHKTHTIQYSMDGSLPNPLEATFAALAGCAGVYAHKACKAMGLSPEGIGINCKPVIRGGNLIVPARFATEVTFPLHFSPEQRQRVLDEIAHCAVKQLIHDGAGIEFVSVEAG